MGIIAWIITGAVAGWLKRRFFPGRPGGLVATLVLAVIGALVGGYIASYFDLGSLATLHPAALGIALAGALLMLLVAAKLRI
ncbi:GlsB/YeaQ/YmgE family stress response membrane protein [Pantoea sp. NGS-ED-1003]|uniref:GlsB/YeaQ/YmgE family stress response membrane protein n=1 Tax=Pantoea sp. NGS-ED-1003 TaxID=1526743 RepID=UPI000534EA02|nr:membrane protein [Pantoea sp. NGS-ED-1003]